HHSCGLPARGRRSSANSLCPHRRNRLKCYSMKAFEIDGHSIAVLFSEDEIALRIDALAKDIAAKQPHRLLVVPVLKGSFVLAAEIAADFRGFTCPDKFVVGYGMDMAHQFRELPFVGYVMTAGSN